MDLTERKVWRVCSGSHTRWFAGELGARDYANDRFDNDFDGVPFVEQVTLSEMLSRINSLEASNQPPHGDVYV